jgi:hypothetical protein
MIDQGAAMGTEFNLAMQHTISFVVKHEHSTNLTPCSLISTKFGSLVKVPWLDLVPQLAKLDVQCLQKLSSYTWSQFSFPQMSVLFVYCQCQSEWVQMILYSSNHCLRNHPAQVEHSAPPSSYQAPDRGCPAKL